MEACPINDDNADLMGLDPFEKKPEYTAPCTLSTEQARARAADPLSGDHRGSALEEVVEELSMSWSQMSVVSKYLC